MDASYAIEQLNADIISYTQSLKSLRDTQRDEKISKYEDYAAAGSTYTSTSGTYHLRYESELRLSSNNMSKENAAYSKETTQMKNDMKKYQSKAKSQVESAYSSASGAYKKALKRAQKAINKQEAVSNSDMKTIGENSNTVYAYLLAYNESLNNLEETRLEEAVVYASNSAAIMENTAEKYNKLDENSQNKIDLNEMKASNTNVAKTANKYLDKAAQEYNTILENDQAEINDYTSTYNSNRKKIGNKKGTTAKLSKASNSKQKTVQKYIDKAKENANKGIAIGAGTMSKLEKYYSEGYVTQSFYQCCVDYNNAIEHKREAEAQLEIDKQTAEEEQRALGQQEFENVQNEYENKTNQNQAKTAKIEAQQSYQTTRGIIMQEQDYRDLINQSQKDVKIYNDEIKALNDQVQHNLDSGYWTTTDQEYIDAMAAIDQLDTEIINCETDQEEWNNAIINLPFEAIDRVLDKLNAISDWYKANQSLFETLGIGMSQSDYEDQIKNLEEQVEQYEAKREEAAKNMAKAAAASDNVYGGKTYEQWQIECIEYDTQVIELESDIQDLINEIINMPFEAIDKALEGLEAMDNWYKAHSSLIQAMSKDLSQSDYEDQIRNLEDQIEQYEAKRAQAAEDMAKALENPDNVYGGKTYEEWKNECIEYDTQVLELQADIEDLVDQLRDDVFWRDFERAHDAAERLLTVLEDITNLISEDMYINANGQITEYGIAQLSNLSKEFANAQTEINNYANDIDNLNKLYKEGLYEPLEYAEKMNELEDSMLGAAQAAQEYSNSIVDMLQQVSRAELDNLEEIIDKRKEALEAKRDYYEYDKTISSQTRDLQVLRSELAALEGIDTAEAASKRKQLEEQISEQEEELNETVLEHTVELSENALDAMTDSLEKAFSDYWDYISQDLDEITELMGVANKISSNSSEAVVKTLEKLLNYYGIDSSYSKTLVSDAGYASGTKSAPASGLARVEELGPELIIRSSTGEILRPISQGDAVIPADLTENLFKWGAIDPAALFSSNAVTVPVVDVESGANITQNFDSLLRVDGNVDSTVVSDLEAFAQQFYEGAYEYNVKHIAQDARKIGIKVGH